jgi:hypothetical protein
MRIDWSDYLRVHTDRANLVIHLVAVPLFLMSFLAFCQRIVAGDVSSAGIALLAALVAMALQGRGHKIENNPPRPFSGPFNFLRRWFTEQFFVFPMFVLTGRWWRQYSQADRPAENEA